MDNNFEDVPMIVQPQNLSISLYKHQLASVYKMEELEREKKIVEEYDTYEFDFAINADATGYGKTLSMVALVLRNKMCWELNEPYYVTNYSIRSNGRFVIKHKTAYTRLNTTLVLTNTSIVSQWVKEFSYTDLDVCVVCDKKTADTIEPDCYDVVIVTNTMYNRLVNRFYKCAWKRFIFDEPGHIKIPNMEKIVSGFTWLVTATPELIPTLYKQRKYNYIMDLLDNINFPSCGEIFCRTYNKIIVKSDPEFIKVSFSMPETIHKYYSCRDNLLRTVRGLVNNKIMEMLYAGNIYDAIISLGGNETDNIVDLIKKNKQDSIIVNKELVQIYTAQNKQANADKCREKIKHLEEQIKEIDERFSGLLNGECPICFEGIKDAVMETNCQNIFCGNCMINCLKSSERCPMCRQNIKKINENGEQTTSLIYINSSTSSHKKKHIENTKTKIEMLEQIIQSNPSGKFIIFSSYDKTFTMIRNFLHEKGVSFSEVKGNVMVRDKTIDSFKHGNTQVLFLNSQHNGSGINLQEATDLILYHKMSDSIIKQVLGRANRIGRNEKLIVHHLFDVEE